MKATAGRVVAMHYTLTDDKGEVLDSSAGGEPLSYLHGHNNIVAGLEKALDGKQAGFKSKVTVAPADAYGEQNPEAIFTEPHASFAPDMKLETGMQIHADGKHGPVTFTVVALTEAGIVLDGNHPLAGKTLHFDVELVEVRKATATELSHGHVHTGHDHH